MRAPLRAAAHQRRARGLQVQAMRHGHRLDSGNGPAAAAAAAAAAPAAPAAAAAAAAGAAVAAAWPQKDGAQLVNRSHVGARGQADYHVTGNLQYIAAI
jgi:hypothetical protein